MALEVHGTTDKKLHVESLKVLSHAYIVHACRFHFVIS